MGEIKENKYVIRYYKDDETYETLGIATGSSELDAIEAYKKRKANDNETRDLTADIILEFNYEEK